MLLAYLNPSLSTEVYVAVHNSPQYDECQHFTCEKMNEMNIFYHAWLFKQYETLHEEQVVEETMYMGIFQAHGIFPTHQSASVEEFRGLSFDTIGPRQVLIVNISFFTHF